MRLADMYAIRDANFEDYQQALDTRSAQVLGSIDAIQREYMETFNVLPPRSCDIDEIRRPPQGAFTHRLRKSPAVQIERRKAA